jgi:hypothetical protein
MAIVVNEQLVAQWFSADEKAGAAKGTQPDDLPDDAILRDADLRQTPARGPV